MSNQVGKSNTHKQKGTKMQHFEPKSEAFSLLKLESASMDVE